VADALRVKLLPDQALLAVEYKPASAEAYQAYLLGKHFGNGFSRDSQVRAVATLQKAVGLDPHR
jgi:hypothetical protein